jgi:hypothetical protein
MQPKANPIKNPSAVFRRVLGADWTVGGSAVWIERTETNARPLPRLGPTVSMASLSCAPIALAIAAA